MSKRFTTLLLFATLLIASTNLFGQSFPYTQDDPLLKKIIELGKTENKTMVWLDYLTNRFGERVSGSDSYNNAAQWAIYEFRKWGVQAELEEVNEVPIGFTHGPAFGRIVTPEEKYLHFATNTNTAPTKGIQSGGVIVLPEDSLKIVSLKGQLKNNWILIDNAVKFNRSPRRGEESFLYKFLEESGALGMVQSSKLPFRLSAKRVQSWEKLPNMPEIILLNTQYDEIKALVEKKKSVTLEFEIRNNFKLGPVKYYNIVAWLPGTEFPDEIISLSGHFDTVPGSAGGVDCGNGCTPAMEALRLIAKSGAKPKRTIMVHLFAAEELGILGSQAWLKAHPSSIPKIAVNINRDYSPGAIVGATVPQSWYEDFKNITEPLKNLNPDFPFTLNLNKYPGAKALRPSGTDASAFSMVGVPTLRLSEKTDHVYNSTYHTNWDTYSDVVPYTKHQEHTALAMAVMAYGIANLNTLLPRNDVYLADGMYADINTSKGRVLTSLDFENAPETIKGFAKMFEQEAPQGQFGSRPSSGQLPGGQRGQIAGAQVGGQRGQGRPAEQPAIGVINLGENNTVLSGEITSDKVKTKAAAELPKEKNFVISHNAPGVIGLSSPTKLYITNDKKADFDSKYIPIGKVIAGLDILNTIGTTDSIKSIRIQRIGQKALNFGK